MQNNTENDDWTIVKNGSRRGTKSKALSKKVGHDEKLKSNNTTLEVAPEIEKSDIESIITIIHTNVAALEGMQFAKDAIDQVLSHIRNSANSSFAKTLQITALGIGNFTDTINSQWQFAFLLLLLKTLRDSASFTEVSLSCFEPQFGPNELRICKTLDIEVLKENNKGLFDLGDDNGDTWRVYYMPHCPYRLYCNLLWSTWFALPNTILIGNR